MFSRILIANRGEIALRVARACKEMRIATVGVYSEADVDSLHLELTDQKVCIGPSASAKSYLNIECIVDAAARTGSDAIHPGYGYLAENQEFAARCEDRGIAFIGPTPANLGLAGDKIAAKRIIEGAGIPVVPSSLGGVGTIEEAMSVSAEIGYPVLIKAAGGGGGRGIRMCGDEKGLREEFPVAKMESRASFGNDEVYIEKLITEPRHIEFQVLADGSGNVAHLGEGECTIQRRYQKLIEESPSPALSPALRQEMGEAAMEAAKAVDYFNAGTVEFLLDKANRFYFMEINARIQVEHPVTELVTGIDLIKEQIRLSSGEKLGYTFDDLDMRGWAIECRINAEDPRKGFLPCPGTVERYQPPAGFGVRVDSHLYQGYELPVFYDSLIAKLIAYDLSREGAIGVMRRALGEFTISPIETTIPLYLEIMEDPSFNEGKFDTSFIEKFVPDDTDDLDDDDEEDE
jgi:acetyl-CoA carboxylase biotin carboxylase subunit